MRRLVRQGEFHLSWGAVIGGTIVTLAVWLLLHTLGIAAGLTAIDRTDPGSLRAVGIGAGIWSIIAPLIALFVGGFVAARTAGLVGRGVGAIHGLVLWGLTTLAGVLLIVMALSGLVRAGAAATTGLAGQVGGQGGIAQTLGIQVNDLLGPINQRLQQEGLPPVTAQQIQAATQDAINQGFREGKLDRETVISAITANTQLNRAEAERLANRIGTQVEQRAQEAQSTALAAAERAGTAMWGVFFALLLGLVSAVLGAIVGVSRQQRRELVEESAVVPPGVPTTTVPQE